MNKHGRKGGATFQDMRGGVWWLTCPATERQTPLFARLRAQLERVAGVRLLDITQVERPRRGLWDKRFMREVLPQIDGLIAFPRADGSIGHYSHDELDRARRAGKPVVLIDRRGRMWDFHRVRIERHQRSEVDYARVVFPEARP